MTGSRSLGGLMIPALLAVALPARGDGQLVTPSVRDALTQIDALPSVSDLDTAFGSTQPLGALLTIAGDTGNDFAVRLRALGAVPAYCTAAPAACADGTDVHAQLLAFTQLPDEPAPADYLWQRAAIEVLGAITTGAPDDVALFVGLLGTNNGQDVRASAASALHNACKAPNQCCNKQVVDAVQRSLNNDRSGQVQIELNAAVNDLNRCTN